MTDSERFGLRVDLSGLRGLALVRLQRSVDFLKFARAGAASVTEEQYRSPMGGLLEVLPARFNSQSLDAVREGAEAWYSLQMLRDAIECVGAYIEEARFGCAALDLAAKGEVSESDLEQLKASKAAFHRKGIPEKLDVLRDTYRIDTENSDSVRSMNRVRNCVVHRLGTVGEQDASAEDPLRMHWIGAIGTLTTADGLTSEVTELPVDVPPGGRFTVRGIRRDREFPLGSQISLSYSEVIEIVLTLVAFVDSLATEVERYGTTGPEMQLGASAAT